MRKIDPNRLEPGEIAFGLHTNAPVDARRFAEFLNLLAAPQLDREIPPFDIEILEIWSGSLFGRLKLVFRESEIDAETNAVLRVAYEAARLNHETVAEVNHALRANAENAERLSDVVDEVVDAWRERVAREFAQEQRVNRERAEAKWLARTAVILAAAALIHDFAADAKSDGITQGSRLVCHLLSDGGVSSIELWCNGAHVVLDRDNVPLVARVAGNQEVREQISDPKDEVGGIFRAGDRIGDPPPRGSRGIDTARSAAEIPIPLRTDLLPPVNWREVELDGTVQTQNGVNYFYPTPITLTNPTPLLLIADPAFGLVDGASFSASGRIYPTEGGGEIFVVTSMRQNRLNQTR